MYVGKDDRRSTVGSCFAGFLFNGFDRFFESYPSVFPIKGCINGIVVYSIFIRLFLPGFFDEFKLSET